MDTPEDQQRSYEEAERCRKKYKIPKDDPQFYECAELLMHLIHKYGREVIQLILQDYRVRERRKK